MSKIDNSFFTQSAVETIMILITIFGMFFCFITETNDRLDEIRRELAEIRYKIDMER